MRLGSSKLKFLTVSDSIHVASFRYCSGSALLRSSSKRFKSTERSSCGQHSSQAVRIQRSRRSGAQRRARERWWDRRTALCRAVLPRLRAGTGVAATTSHLFDSTMTLSDGDWQSCRQSPTHPSLRLRHKNTKRSKVSNTARYPQTNKHSTRTQCCSCREDIWLTVDDDGNREIS